MKFKKLSINRETIRNLKDRELGNVVGGKAPNIYLPTGALNDTMAGCATCLEGCYNDNTAFGCVPFTQICSGQC